MTNEQVDKKATTLLLYLIIQLTDNMTTEELELTDKTLAQIKKLLSRRKE